MSDYDGWMYARIAELEARLELATKQAWEAEQKLAQAQQRIQQLESQLAEGSDYLRLLMDDLK